MLRLIGLSVSPATERARWALDYCGLAYSFEEYLPQITTPWVRLRTRRWTGPVSVPILLGPQQLNLPDSWDIAQYAAQQQPAAALIPPPQRNQIAQLNQLSENIFFAGRILAVDRTLQNEAALLEACPAFFPRVVHRPLLPVIRNTYKTLAKKYSSGGTTVADQLQILDPLLQQMRVQLDGQPFMLGQAFSYADITLIAALQVIKPVHSRSITLGPASVPCWTCDDLAHKYQDLIQWRDSLYQARRYLDYNRQPVAMGQ